MRESGCEIIRRAAHDPVHLYDEVVIEIMGAFGDCSCLGPDFGFEVFYRFFRIVFEWEHNSRSRYSRDSKPSPGSD